MFNIICLIIITIGCSVGYYGYTLIPEMEFNILAIIIAGTICIMFGGIVAIIGLIALYHNDT